MTQNPRTTRRPVVTRGAYVIGPVSLPGQTAAIRKVTDMKPRRPRKHDRRTILSFIDMPEATARTMMLEPPARPRRHKRDQGRRLADAVPGVVLASELPETAPTGTNCQNGTHRIAPVAISRSGSTQNTCPKKSTAQL